jgi:adenine-specific DNA methylase
LFSKKGSSEFILASEAIQFILTEYHVEVKPGLLEKLTEFGLIPSFFSPEGPFFLRNDLESFLPLFSGQVDMVSKTLKPLNLFSENEYSNLVPISKTQVLLPENIQLIEPTFFSAFQNICREHLIASNISTEKKTLKPYFSSTQVSTVFSGISELIDRQLLLSQKIDQSDISKFANTAQYMGSKKAISGFLVEAISRTHPAGNPILDLMCGSGAASSAFSRVWPTTASDSQKFSRLLAKVQGGGFDTPKAQVMIEKIFKIAQENANSLRGMIGDFLETEEDCFSEDNEVKLFDRYKKLLNSFPLFQSGIQSALWKPDHEIERRKQDPKIFPYCLFTGYFANIYFGLRQSIEIDSIRFAIDSLDNEEEKDWALGTLIATLSNIATTYAGHFAQPVVKPSLEISNSTLFRILNKRSVSVYHEFGMRLINLASESEKNSNPVKMLEGPWKNALNQASGIFSGKDLLVYLDPPYTRDEYSRYYHVLETLVQYSYPSVEGAGRAPSKSKGERFRSEFFTRVPERAEQALHRVISEVLSNGWKCALSYSNTGTAQLSTTIKSVLSTNKTSLHSYSLPYEHKSQGGRSPKMVTEHLIFFS